MKKIFNRKGVFVKSLSVWSAFATVATTAAPTFAAGTAVLGGSAQLSQLTRVTMDRNDPNVAVFSSTEASGVLDWSRFNIGLGQSMSFNGSGTTFFNLVDGAAGKSQIDGIINGSGNVWVINPAGIAFGANASVNVGGLFAAAAGNLENAAALRDGTAMSPSFSSFAGTVDASKGTFTANQVALMGKTVTTAGGDFSRVKDLSVTATGGATEVDDVGGGKVSVNIRDFADDGAEVTLGDLNIDGDLSVKATGNVVTRAAQPEASATKPMLQSVTKAGPVIQAGDIDIEAATDLAIDGELLSTAGHVDVLAYGKMDVNADVTAADYASLKAMGDVNVNADVTAGGNATIYSNNGSVTLEAGKTVSALGNVDITAGISDGAKGNVTINGNVGSSFGNVMLYSGYGDQSTGDVTINGEVSGYGVDAYAGFGYGLGTAGNLTVNGSVFGGEMVQLRTGNGNITVGENAQVSASGDYGFGGEIDIFTAADAGFGLMDGTGHSGDIVINGDVWADSAYGVVQVIAGKEEGATGSVTLNGAVASDYISELATRTGNITVNGMLLSAGDVYVDSESGNISVSKDAAVRSLGDSAGIAYNAVLAEEAGETPDLIHTVYVLSATAQGGTGNVTIDGTVAANGEKGIVRVATGKTMDPITGELVEAGSGNVILNGKVSSSSNLVKIQAKDGAISGSGSVSAMDAYLEADGDVSLNGGQILGADGVTIQSHEGAVDVGKATLKSAGETTLSAKEDILAANPQNGLSGTVSADGGTIVLANKNRVTLGDVTAGGDLSVTADGMIMQDEGAKINASGNAEFTTDYVIKLDNDGNDFNEISAKGSQIAIWDVDDMTAGEVEATHSAVQLVTYKGDLTVKEGASVKAVGNVELTSGFANNQKGDVVINGNVTSAGDDGVFVTAGHGSGSSGKVIIGKSGSIETTSEKGWVGIGANGTATDKGGIDIDGDVHANDYVQVQAVNGDIRIGSEAVISTAAKHGDRRSIRIATIDPDGVGGNIAVDGKLVANGGGSAEVISETTDSNKGLTSTGTGDVTINGTIDADGTAFAAAGFVPGTSGKLTVNGTMTGKEEVLLATGNGAAEVNGDVASDGGRVGVVSGINDGGEGGLTINGEVKAKTDFVAFVSYGNGTKGDAVVNGSVEAGNMVAIETGDGEIRVAQNGLVRSSDAKGQVFLQSSAHDMAQGGITVSGMVEASGKGGNVQLVSAMGERANGSVSVSGTVRASDSVHVLVGYGENSVGSASVDGGIVAGNVANVLTRTGSVAVNGAVSGGRSVHVETGVENGGSGDVVFGANGQLRAGENAEVRTSGGDVRQRGAVVNVDRSGFAEPKSLHAAVNAPNVGFSIRGDVGSGNSYVAVNGKTFAAVSGNASIAAANGSSFRGGVKPAHTPGVSVSVANIQMKEAGSSWTVDATPITQSIAHSIDWGGAGDNSSILANGDLSIYTAGALNPYGLMVAGRDLTVSAASFGDMSYLRAGGRLTVNNVGHPSHPQVAYFESVNGVEPNIENLPNDMVIFVDGRLAGGNLNILNKFGADEAFMVETPELKSTQGIFGNPPFLHSDLDVANPMEVSAIDYLIQEVPRLTLSSDFPADVDQNVEATGLSQKDVYWFGHKGADEKKAGEVPDENTAEEDKKAEKPADANVAMAH